MACVYNLTLLNFLRVKEFDKRKIFWMKERDRKDVALFNSFIAYKCFLRGVIFAEVVQPTGTMKACHA